MLFGYVAGFQGWPLTRSTDNVTMWVNLLLRAWPSVRLSYEKPWSLWFVLREATMKAHHQAKCPVSFFTGSFVRFLLIGLYTKIIRFSGCLFLAESSFSAAECFARNETMNWHVSERNPVAIFSWRPTSLGSRPPKGIRKRRPKSPCFLEKPPGGDGLADGALAVADKCQINCCEVPGKTILQMNHLWWQTFFATLMESYFRFFPLSTSADLKHLLIIELAHFRCYVWKSWR